jgi:Rhodopirellula transposase DDE domain
MQDAQTIGRIRRKYQSLLPEMDERRRRQWAAAEARELGWGGVSLVAHATGLSRPTIMVGLRELDQPIPQRAALAERVRRPGGGRRPLSQTTPALLPALEALVEPVTRGDPESPLRWTCKSTRRLAEELTRQGYRVGARTVASLLHEAGYSLQANRKTREGLAHPDRNAQFEYINASVARSLIRNQPAISVDTKKKELIGPFKNAGREWEPCGEPVNVNAYDFPDLAEGKAIPYGVYDLAQNEGWVSVGTDHDTAAFAVAAIRQWWARMGRTTHPTATELLITADSGGSNSARARLWKVELQRLADQTGLRIMVCHFPPARASGTRSSTGCSATSRRTGGVAHSSAMRSWSILSRTPLLQMDSRSAHESIVVITQPGSR